MHAVHAALLACSQVVDYCGILCEQEWNEVSQVHGL